MTYEEAIDMVLTNPFEKWTYFDEYGEYVLKSDVNLRIIRKSLDVENDKFEGERWATNHPDSTAYKIFFSIFYNNSRIDDFILVAVDGSRATIPMPEVNTTIISKKCYLFAQAVNTDGKRLDEYIQRSGLSVEE